MIGDGYNYVNPLLADNRFGIFFKWKTALTLIGTEFHQQNLVQYIERLKPHFNSTTPLNHELIELLDIMTLTSTPTILDIGAGPISKVGKIYQGKKIALTPIDPIAKRYNKILKKLNYTPPCPTQKGVGETLSKQFNKNTFDLIHARNSVDHTNSPAKVITEALEVLKPGGYLYLNHYQNEADAANYYGLHQWNFYEKEKCFFIGGKNRKAQNVNLLIAGIATVEAIKTTNERIIVIINKHNNNGTDR